MRRAHLRVSRDADEAQSGFAISPHQIEAVLRPRVLSAGMILVPARAGEFIGRPYRVWREDPELARDLNDRLTGDAD